MEEVDAGAEEEVAEDATATAEEEAEDGGGGGGDDVLELARTKAGAVTEAGTADDRTSDVEASEVEAAIGATVTWTVV